MKIQLIGYLLLLLVACSPKERIELLLDTEDLKVTAINQHLFIHKSYLQTDDFGKVGCNGMVYFNGDKAIIFDTPTTDKESNQLINWVQNEQKKQVEAIVVTHFHEDCLGGLAAFHKRNIPSYTNTRTKAILLEQEAEVIPTNTFNVDTTLLIGNEQVVLKYYGEGHTSDNCVGYIPAEEALFGGCLIKRVAAGKGYLGDANTAEWSNTVRRIKKELPNLKIVVPGHGKFGGNDLLDYTITLFSE